MNIPEFTAEKTIYKSSRSYSTRGNQSKPSTAILVPQATNLCVTNQQGQTGCTVVHGIAEGILWGGFIGGAVGGGAGAAIGAAIGAVWCWIVGCD
jgi:outer membrane lipoprotein SlyB